MLHYDREHQHRNSHSLLSPCIISAGSHSLQRLEGHCQKRINSTALTVTMMSDASGRADSNRHQTFCDKEREILESRALRTDYKTHQTRCSNILKYRRPSNVTTLSYRQAMFIYCLHNNRRFAAICVKLWDKCQALACRKLRWTSCHAGLGGGRE